ncbi:MAG: peptidase M28 [Dehalococcoides mccartyi]|uniref:M48 family metallopeptidase n=1 Tax=Dehalococcoides mccartyi TaxID=61435 RepID=UPI00080510A8|nr:M48 family metallopeptidase [Dehalococcoides mccartyi]OBW62719.1 MAG: peptidase M28 [Dehalococcoides mccartyi]
MWEQIQSNRTRSIMLVIGMGLILVALGYALGMAFTDNGLVGLVIALVLWGIMNLIALTQGDSILLGMANAKEIKPSDHPRLYNVVEEMKIASGMDTMPKVYIIDDPALNAFATGRDKNHISVAITSGLLQKLNRDELQGVIGHEMAHIKNRDVSLMVWCSILLGTIVILAQYGSRMFIFGGGSRRSSSNEGSGGGAQAILMVAALLLIVLAPLFAQLIYFAISRKREYLADASSAQYTRYPEGLASALEKLGASTEQLRSANQATAPMYIINPFRAKGKAAANLTSTHPPINERVRILRSMNGASYHNYDEAFKQVKGGHVIPPTAIKLDHDETIREASDEGPLATEIGRARETSNALWNMNKYQTVDCDCGVRLRVPPGLKGQEIQCPHCGEIHQT